MLKSVYSEKQLWDIVNRQMLNEYSGRFYTPIPQIGNHRSDMKETAIPF